MSTLAGFLDRQEPKHLNVLDPSFPLIASQAAAELDRFERDLSDDLSATNSIYKLLENSVIPDPSSESVSIRSDAATSSALRKAAFETSGRRITDLAELSKELHGILKLLNPEGLKANRQHAGKCREFCAHLGMLAAMYSRPHIDTTKSHPFRR